ncbi:hypothetical protein FD754_014868 [Muntiacus muntjak]|uniref:Uncharacterized protein n=1 Tax=Muntiacus muntjak TaxID=9888 RepID=A0A5N3VL87_MUNMU|nr:hypothetical protein FD754_014868 [Muntiacus muntjak]
MASAVLPSGPQCAAAAAAAAAAAPPGLRLRLLLLLLSAAALIPTAPTCGTPTRAGAALGATVR